MSTCPLCEREIPKGLLTRHHLKTRRTDKDFTEGVCVDCHRAIHGLFENRELRKDLGTIKALKENAQVAAAVSFIQKQPVGVARPTKKRKWFRR